MTARQPRWEVVRTDAGWTARFVAANGRVLLSSTSQGYRRQADALAVIEVVEGEPVRDRGHGIEVAERGDGPREVRVVDERAGEVS